ncbi:MAG: cyclic nucleotide-binding domain-containing protein [Verrucomicrobiales bacterium]|nr:cyclic nucleotide-binding domain-containing protein [Verrucomicrobiales bacterium]
MTDYLFSPAVLVYVGLAFQALGFLARDELWLRFLILLGTCFYLSYYCTISNEPLFEAILASGILGAINLGMIIVLIFERTTFTMSEERAKIYRSFPTLNPGQFRKVMRAGVAKEGDPGTVLVTDGAPLDRLILVTSGQIKIAKGNKEYFADASAFIGEVSFLQRGNASATVSISETAKYMEWKHNELREMMRKSPAMNNALIALFGAELAGKVKNAMPVDVRQASGTA